MSEVRKQRIECNMTPWQGRDNACQWCDADLKVGGKRTVWCSNACALAWERNHVWRKARTAARRRDKYACRECGVKRSEGVALEVNHIEPLVGRGYHYGCVHHQSNLETLCKKHHVEKTNQQRAARKTQTE
jgi:hypothetical protein